MMMEVRAVVMMVGDESWVRVLALPNSQFRAHRHFEAGIGSNS